MRVGRTMRWFLWPFSLVYEAVVRVRAWCYAHGVFRARRLPGTVISVGNLTVGGTGKTPLVLWIAERLAGEGKKTSILTRGYRAARGGSSRGEPQSDEIALLRERLDGRVSLGVGADRFATGMTLARHGTEWFVLDDGLQHLKLARDADIVMIDATEPFGGGMLLPAGRLREPVSALQRADVVVISRAVQAPSPALEAKIRRYTQRPVFYARTELESVLRWPALKVAWPQQDWRRGRLVAFCAIGNPSAFFSDLRGWGFQIAGERAFADHHAYTAKEAAQLEQLAERCSADALICTEKDAWNLRRVRFERVPVYCCRISLQLPDEFSRALLDAAQKHAGART